MKDKLLTQLETSRELLEPQFKALRATMGALKLATKLASEEKLDALAMQKALTMLTQANEQLEDTSLQAATDAFAAETQTALDALAFQFARDLKDVFESRGETVAGRPPTLVVGGLVLHIDSAARKAQWFYGKEALTRPIPLSINAILKAYGQQQKAIIQREVDAEVFLDELYKAWQKLRAKQKRPPNRMNIVKTYSRLVINRQSSRFWNNPSRSTFKDYSRPLFVRDMVLIQATPTVTIDGRIYHVRLGVATKSQADSASRSMWLPNGPLDGEYYSDITFEPERE
ncbi:MAG: hypothetical protein GY759_17710 [Chloroflexi bacterium]|nr:hypothetical protein [Chloroflexota bacterium]